MFNLAHAQTFCRGVALIQEQDFGNINTGKTTVHLSIFPFPSGSSPSANFQRSSRTREAHASRAPWVSKYTHHRKFSNHVTVQPSERPSVRTTGKPMFTHIFQLVWERRKKLIAHQCCDQMTAVKTGHPLTSTTWPYRGVRCRPIEVKYFLKLSADKLLVLKGSQAPV